MNIQNLSTLKIHKLTKEQYEREKAAGNLDANALYLTPDEEIDLSPYATIEQLNEKANIEHNHTIEDIENFQAITEAQIDELCPDFVNIEAITTSVNEIDAMLGE